MKAALNKLQNSLQVTLKNNIQVLCFFIHGSFANKNFGNMSYLHEMYYKKNRYSSSTFSRLDLNSDIDLVMVVKDKKNRARAAVLLQEFFLDYQSKTPITINLLTQNVFEKESLLNYSSAIKLILAIRKIDILWGKEYLDLIKKQAKQKITLSDRQFLHTFDSYKKYVKRVLTSGSEKISITAKNFEKKFLDYYQFLAGQRKAGFPEDRIKLVFPIGLSLKKRIDIGKNIIIKTIR